MSGGVARAAAELQRHREKFAYTEAFPEKMTRQRLRAHIRRVEKATRQANAAAELKAKRNRRKVAQ